jgi:hypothetical protein
MGKNGRRAAATGSSNDARHRLGIEQPEYEARVTRVTGSWSSSKHRLLESPAQNDRCTVLADVVSGYVSLEIAERDYGIVIQYLGTSDQLVRLLEHYAVDEEATARLRMR